MLDREVGSNAEVVMPVSDLHGRTVWSEGGQRIGSIRDINTDDEGRIVSFDVRERWFFGTHHEVPATDMRLDGGDVIVPNSAVASMHTREARVREREHVESSSGSSPSHGLRSAPVLLAGREGVRARFGGLDLLGSLFGGLVIIASMVIIGGVLAAIFGVDPPSIDTSSSAFDDLVTGSLLVGAATLFLSCFLGGWCAGRSARYDGVANGVMSVVWALAIALGLGALASWVGDEYDVLAQTNLPSFSNDELATWGLIGFAIAIALMLVGAALGGALGESWHRRADRAMLDVVPVGGGVASSDTVVMDRTSSASADDRTMLDRSSDEGVVSSDAPRVVDEPAPRRERFDDLD
jgi:hypothetical protein